MLGVLIFGYMFLLYGIYKFLICYLDIALTYEQRNNLLQKMSWLKHVLSMDISTAGRTLSIIYIVFALITIFRSVERIQTGIIHSDVAGILNERLFIYVIYGLLGILLVTIYSLVVYTQFIAIPKNNKYDTRYKLAGICGGLTFIASVPVMFILHKIFDHGFSSAMKQYKLVTTFSLLFIASIVGIIGYIGYTILNKDECEKKHVLLHEIISLFIIPTNVI
jgi:hypothetical protein